MDGLLTKTLCLEFEEKCLGEFAGGVKARGTTKQNGLQETIPSLCSLGLSECRPQKDTNVYLHLLIFP